LSVDAEISLHDLNLKAVKELDWLGPFGQMHRRPIFSSSRVELVDSPSTMGGGGRHLALKVREGSKTFRAVAFGKGDWAEEIAAVVQGPFSICFSASINHFRGYENVELQLIDWKSSSSQVSSK